MEKTSAVKTATDQAEARQGGNTDGGETLVQPLQEESPSTSSKTPITRAWHQPTLITEEEAHIVLPAQLQPRQTFL